jgi:hypothetical protein
MRVRIVASALMAALAVAATAVFLLSRSPRRPPGETNVIPDVLVRVPDSEIAMDFCQRKEGVLHSRGEFVPVYYRYPGNPHEVNSVKYVAHKTFGDAFIVDDDIQRSLVYVRAQGSGVSQQATYCVAVRRHDVHFILSLNRQDDGSLLSKPFLPVRDPIGIDTPGIPQLLCGVERETIYFDVLRSQSMEDRASNPRMQPDTTVNGDGGDEDM